MRRTAGLIVLCGTVGCAGNAHVTSHPPATPPTAPARADFDVAGSAPHPLALSTRPRSSVTDSAWMSHQLERPPAQASAAGQPVVPQVSPVQMSPIRTVAHRPQTPPELKDATLTIDGRQYRVQLVEEPAGEPDGATSSSPRVSRTRRTA